MASQPPAAATPAAQAPTAPAARLWAPPQAAQPAPLRMAPPNMFAQQLQSQQLRQSPRIAGAAAPAGSPQLLGLPAKLPTSLGGGAAAMARQMCASI